MNGIFFVLSQFHPPNNVILPMLKKAQERVEGSDISPDEKRKAKAEFLFLFRDLPSDIDKGWIEMVYDIVERELESAHPRSPLPGQKVGERQMAHCKRAAMRAIAFGFEPSISLSAKILAHDLLEEGHATLMQIDKWFGDEVARSVQTLTMEGSGPGIDPPIENREKLWEKVDRTPYVEDLVVSMLDGVDSGITYLALTSDKRLRKIRFLREFCMERWLPRIERLYSRPALILGRCIPMLVNEIEASLKAEMPSEHASHAREGTRVG